MKKSKLITTSAMVVGLIGSASLANAATIASSNLDGNTLGSTVTWVTDGANSSMVTDNLTAIGGDFAVFTNNSTDNDILNNVNLSGGAAQGFSFQFTTTVAYDLTDFSIDAGHLNGSGGNQSYISDLDLAIEGISGTTFSYSASKDQIDYSSGAVREEATFDLTGQTLAAGTYQVSISMQEGTASIGGAYSSFDNVALTGTIAVPEPSSTTLLGLGGLALMMRRRK